MVNTRTDAELAVAVQNALQTLLPQIRAEIREEFRTSSGPSGSGGNPPPYLRRRQLPLAVYKFEGHALAWWKAYKKAKDGDVWLIIVTWAEFKELFFLQFFSRAEQERLKREYHSIRQTDTKTSTEFMQRFLRLAGFLGAAAGTAEEQAKNFQWGLRKSTLNHLMCITFTDMVQVANAARDYEILHERDDDDVERPDKRQKSGDRHQPTTQQSSHRNHGHNNDRHGSDRRGGDDNHRNNNNYSGNNNMSAGNGRDQRNRGQQSNRPVNSDFQQSMGPSEGYSYPVCTTDGDMVGTRWSRGDDDVWHGMDVWWRRGGCEDGVSRGVVTAGGVVTAAAMMMIESDVGGEWYGSDGDMVGTKWSRGDDDVWRGMDVWWRRGGCDDGASRRVVTAGGVVTAAAMMMMESDVGAEKAILRQRYEINGRMAEMFRILKELTSSATPEKVLVREEIRNPITKNVNAIPLYRIESKKVKENNEVIDKNIIEQEKRSIEELIRITNKEPLVDQGSDMNVMPLSTYNRLTDEKLVETDIRLSLASLSHIYPLGIAKDMLVEIAGFAYPVDFIILDIKKHRKKPFILGTPFLTMARAEIKFDKGTITLISGKSKVNSINVPSSFANSKKEKKIK
nr:hypothetical protein [Tanacetum cinerariifolium]